MSIDSLVKSLVTNLSTYKKWMALAQKQTGKRPFTQIREILALRQTGGQCGISDYYNLGLYDENLIKGRGVQDFLGWRLHNELSYALNSRAAVLPAWDKCTFIVIAKSAGLPVAPVYACYHPAKSISEALGFHLKTKADVGAFLRDPSVFPLFGKPSWAQQGFGTSYLVGYNADTDSLNLLDGSSINVDRFLQNLQKPVHYGYHKPECGYIFQKPLVSAPEIQSLTNWPAICGVRVICLNDQEGVRPIQALWKIAVPPNHTDNYCSGKNGNLHAVVDLATGEIRNAMSGYWPEGEIIKTLPFSGQSVVGFRLPHWNKVLEICENAGAIFPLMKIQHWDFALTADGPVILELNDIGGIAQVHGYGVLTEETRKFLKQHANQDKHKWVKAM